MRTDTKFVIILLAAILPVFAGCAELMQQPAGTNIEQQPQNTVAPSRFQEPSAEPLLAVKEKNDLNEKLNKLTEDFTELQKKNKEASVANQALNEELEKYKSDHDQAKKELKEANELLVEMRIELNSWKKDILGFREEMRGADIAQLEALFKILKILAPDFESTPEEATN